MKPKILFLIFAFAFISSTSAIQEPLIYYKINLDYSYGNISVNSVDIELSNENLEFYNGFGFFSATILDYDVDLLNLTLFNVPNQILYDTIDEETGEINGGGELELNQTDFDIYVHYYENAKEIKIYDENLTELTKRDVDEFSKIQGSVAEEKPEKTDTEQGTKIKPAENLTDKLSQYWLVLIFILIILIFYLFYSLTQKK